MALIANNGIFLVVACVASDCHDGIATSRKFFEVEQLHGLGADKRLLRVVEDMRHRVHAHRVVRSVDTHGLLAHRALISVPWRLVVVREGND